MNKTDRDKLRLLLKQWRPITAYEELKDLAIRALYELDESAVEMTKLEEAADRATALMQQGATKINDLVAEVARLKIELEAANAYIHNCLPELPDR